MLTQTKTKESMNFSLNEDQTLLRQTIRDFVEKEVIPHAKEWDEKEEPPLSTIKKLSNLGIMGMTVDHKYGGSKLDPVSIALLCI